MKLSSAGSLNCSLVFLAMTLGAATVSAEVPEILYQTDDVEGPPGWISKEHLDEAIGASRAPAGSRLEAVDYLFSRESRLSSALEEYDREKSFELTPSGEIASCEPMFVSYYYGEKAANLSMLIELSQFIVVVDISSSKAGFFWAQAGQLLRADIISVVEDPNGVIEPTAPLLLFQRYARMVIDGRPICLGSNPIKPGRYLLFMLYEPIYDVGLPVAFIDNGALVASDGSASGALVDSTINANELKGQLKATGFDSYFEGAPR